MNSIEIRFVMMKRASVTAKYNVVAGALLIYEYVEERRNIHVNRK